MGLSKAWVFRLLPTQSTEWSLQAGTNSRALFQVTNILYLVSSWKTIFEWPVSMGLDKLIRLGRCHWARNAREDIPNNKNIIH